jgi:biotin transporter BioY
MIPMTANVSDIVNMAAFAAYNLTSVKSDNTIPINTIPITKTLEVA